MEFHIQTWCHMVSHLIRLEKQKLLIKRKSLSQSLKTYKINFKNGKRMALLHHPLSVFN